MILNASLLGHDENRRVNAIKYSNYSMESSDEAKRTWASGSHLLKSWRKKPGSGGGGLDLFMFLSEIKHTLSTVLNI